MTKSEADQEVLNILDLYRRVYEDLLAVPVIPGKKSEKEKFAGGDYTTTVEGFVPTTGRGIQGATSHHLGQNFSKMFDITVESPDKSLGKDNKVFVYQNSWGLSTRVIGVMVMIHGDDQGLVLPPRVALQQVIIVPVGLSKGEGKNEAIYDGCLKLERELVGAGIRAKADLRDGYTPGWKFNDWEMRGVPLRLELGPRDLAANTALAVRRYDNNKIPMPLGDIANTVRIYLDKIQADMLARASETFSNSLKGVTKWDEVVPTLDGKCIVVMPWCENEACEDDVKERSKGQWVCHFPGRREPHGLGRTKVNLKMPKRHQQARNRCVSHSTKSGSASFQMGRSRNVYSVGRKRRVGRCLAGVSGFKALDGVVADGIGY